MSQAGTINVSSEPGVVDFLQGNIGGPVAPDASSIIHVVGSGALIVTGNPATHTLTISSNSMLSWVKISSSQTLASGTGYFCVGGGALSLALPATSSTGDTIEVVLAGSTSWTITQSAGQQIIMGNLQSTSGVAGSLRSTQQGDSIRLVCLTANLVWYVISSMGNPTII